MASKFAQISCAFTLAIIFLCYLKSKDVASCTVRGAEFNGVDGYYYASGGNFIQLDKSNFYWQQPIDSIDILNSYNSRRPDPTTSFTIHLSKNEWTINIAGSTIYQNSLSSSIISGSTADSYLFYPPSQGWILNESPDRTSSMIVNCSGRLSASRPTLEQMHPNPSSHPPSNLQLMYNRPVTTLILIGIMGYWYALYSNQIDPSVVSFSYEKIVTDGEWIRLFTAAFAHFDLMHLCFNGMMVYQLGAIEEVYGSARYAYLSLALVVITGFICLLLSYILIYRMQQEDARFQQAVGYSCVLFAWIVAASVRMREFCPIIFAPDMCFKTWFIPVIQFPVNLGPVALLVITKLIIPRSSFMGHLSGILIGLPLAWNALDWLHPMWLISTLTVMFMLSARDRLWIWKNSYASSYIQDSMYYVQAVNQSLCVGYHFLGRHLKAVSGNRTTTAGSVYSAVNVSEEQVPQAHVMDTEDTELTEARTAADVKASEAWLTGMCCTADTAWMHLDHFVPADQMKIYNTYRWLLLVILLGGLMGFSNALRVLWTQTNVVLFLLRAVSSLSILFFLLWMSHQAVRICYLSESAATLQACVQVMMITLLYTAADALNQAATIGVFAGAFSLVDANISIAPNGQELTGNATNYLLALYLFMFFLDVLACYCLVMLLQNAPNVERLEVLGRMRLVWLSPLFENS
jgi:membrane associated rhomboid family serine protease